MFKQNLRPSPEERIASLRSQGQLSRQVLESSRRRSATFAPISGRPSASLAYPEDKERWRRGGPWKAFMTRAASVNWASAICLRTARLESCAGTPGSNRAVIQNRFYAKTRYDRDIRPSAEREVLFYQSFWTLTANPEVLAAPDLIELAAKYGRSPAQMFFRYLDATRHSVSDRHVVKDHMQQDLSIFEFRLSPEECESLGALLLRSP